MKKLFVAAAAIAIASLSISPASAQTGVKASLSGVSSGQAVSGSVGLRGCGSAGTGVKKIEILIDGRVVQSQEFGNLQNEACTDHGWDTTRSGSSLSRNGDYSITVRVDAAGGSNAETTSSVIVDNAPSSPSGVSVNNSGGHVTVSWVPNPEPDIAGYKIERDSGSGWSTVGDTQSTNFSETVGYGNHSYRVIALRRSSVSGTKASGPSGPGSISYANPATGSPSTGSGSGGGDTGSGSGGTGSGVGSGSGSGTGGGGGVPGYSSGSGGGNGNGGRDGGSRGPSVGGKSGLPGGYGSSGSRQLSGIGLPGGLTLPGRGGASAGSIPGATLEDGTFEEVLPYALPTNSDGTLVNDPGNPFRPAFVNDMTIIPPDALRWVAAGVWLMVTAALLKFLERRVAAKELAEVKSLPVAEETAA